MQNQKEKSVIELEESKYLLNNDTLGKKINTKIVLLSIFNSLKIGLFSFGIVFIFLLFAKFLAVLTNSENQFSFGINEFIFALWGFIIGSFITISPTLKSLLK